MYELAPVGLAAAPVANQVSFRATFKEKLCRPICVINSVQPQVTINYTVGTMRLVGTTVFVPVTAVITMVTPTNCCAATTKLYTETFTVAFQGRTALPSTVTINSVGRTMEPSCIKCNKAHSYTINDSLVVSIASTSTASETSTENS
jgi:non-ribosomal peptide synthetase component F